MEILYTTPTHYFKYGIILRNLCQNGANLTIRKSHLSGCHPKNVEHQEDLGQHPHLDDLGLSQLPHRALRHGHQSGLHGNTGGSDGPQF